MDILGNMLTTIRNAQAVKKEAVLIPYSKLRMQVAEVISKEGFVGNVSRKGKKNRKFLSIELKYKEDGSPVIENIQRVSKLSKRVYVKAKEIFPVQKGYGMQVLTTPKGMLTGKDARKQNIGGEIICKIW